MLDLSSHLYEALKRAGFIVEPYTDTNKGVPIVPIMNYIYGRIEDKYMVYDGSTNAYIASYPPLGHYSNFKKVIHILESVAIFVYGFLLLIIFLSLSLSCFDPATIVVFPPSLCANYNNFV